MHDTENVTTWAQMKKNGHPHIAWDHNWVAKVHEALGKQAQTEQVVRAEQDIGDPTAPRRTIGEINDSRHGTEKKLFPIQVLLPNKVNATRDKIPSVWSEPIHLRTGWVQKVSQILGREPIDTDRMRTGQGEIERLVTFMPSVYQAPRDMFTEFFFPCQIYIAGNHQSTAGQSPSNIARTGTPP